MHRGFSLLFTICYFGCCTSLSNGLICFSCGTEGINDWLYPMVPEIVDAELDMESCESFQSAFAWGPFSQHCEDFQWCGKIVTAFGQSVVRGCVSRNDSAGQLHRLGCGSMTSSRIGPSDSEMDVGDQFCLCDTNYCNSSNILSFTYFMFLSALVMFGNVISM